MRPEKVGVFRQVLRPEPGIVPPYFYESIELLYLVNAERSLDLCGSKVVARVDKQEPRIDVTVLRSDLVRVLQVSNPAEGPDRPGLFSVPIIVCDNHPALNGGDVVREVEAEGRQVTQAANFPAVDFGPVCLAGILYDKEVMCLSYLQHPIHVTRIPEQVDDHYRSRLLCDSLFDLVHVKIESLQVYVNENRQRPAVNDGKYGRCPCDCWSNDFVAWPDVAARSGIRQYG